MTEAELVELILVRCDHLGLHYHHCRDSRYCQGAKGFLDLLILGRRGALAWEIKSAEGRLSLAQMRWIGMLRDAGITTAVRRPEDWDSGLIARELEEIA